MMRGLGAALLVCLLGACAQVPKESVELSATVGRDLATAHQAHREVIRVLFARMRADVQRFVEDVYAPYQIDAAMKRQTALADSASPEERRKSLLLAINAAFRPGASPELRRAVLQGMGVLVQQIHVDVEMMRDELLTPLAAQESEVLGSVDRAYQQLHYANSIVTGHLASITKVHDAQNEALKALGIERDLRADIAQRLGKASTNIGALVERAAGAERKLEEAEGNAQKLKETIGELAARAKN